MFATLVLAAVLACGGADRLASPIKSSTDSTSKPGKGSPKPDSVTPKPDTTKPKPDTTSPPADTTTTPDTTTNPDTTTPPADTATPSGTVATNECASPKAGWLFCDDFESNRFSKYFEYDSAGGSFSRRSSVGVNGSMAMRAHFDVGQVNAGSLKLAFGKTPSSYLKPVDAGTALYREIYWRAYVRYDATWRGGGGDKWSRAQSLVTNSWAQAMTAQVWSGGSASDWDYLLLDPATGTDNAGTLLTTTYNDFAHLRYLGAVKSQLAIFSSANVGKWYCVEAHVKLNDAGKTNGMFELWINGTLQASKTSMNWLGSYSSYGVNTLFLENYWNTGSPASQSRYLDNVVVSTSRIGCGT